MRTKRDALSTVLIVFVGAAIGTYLFAVFGKEMGWGVAITIYTWIESNFNMVLGTTATAAIGAGAKVFLSLLNKGNITFKDVGETITTITGASEGIIKAGSDLDIKLKEFGDIEQKLQALFNENTGVKEQNKIMQEKQDILIDLMLCYVFKDSGDQTIADLRVKFAQSDLLSKVAELKNVTMSEETAEEDSKKIDELVAAAEPAIELVKKVAAQKAKQKVGL